MIAEIITETIIIEDKIKEKSFSNSIPEVLCLMKKRKEEEKNIFVPIVDQLTIPLTIAH